MSSPAPLADLLTTPWAITPEKLLELQAIYARHFAGEAADLASIEARLGRPLANDQQEYTLRPGGVALLQVSGVIAPKANMFTRVSGGASASVLQAQVASMRDDPRVVSALIEWDTPGGNVFGIPGLASAIAELAAAKPTVSISTGMMASAGYWAGSAANAVYISGLTDMLGSLGVLQTHTYDPRKAAVQTTEITAGRYKRLASDNQPLTAEGRAYIQSQVDEVYRVFVDAVATHRGVSAEDVLTHMADGRIFIGQQALDAGLADGVMSVEALAEAMATDPGKFASRRRAVFAAVAPKASAKGGAKPTTPTTSGVHTVTPQEQAAAFAAEHPEAAAHLRLAAATAERERINAVRAQVLPGHEALIDKLANDGTSTAADAALAVNAAERSLADARRQALASDTPPPLAADAQALGNEADDADTAPQAVAHPMAGARALAAAIATKQAEARQAGRTLSAVDALAIVKKEQSNG